MILRAIIIFPIFVFLAASPFACGSPSDLGVFKSQDGGESWQHKVTIDDKKNISKVPVSDIEFDPQDSKIIYLGTMGSGLYMSTDNGDTWQQVRCSRVLSV